MAMSDAERLEQLAACQALYKMLGEMLSTKNPDGLRGELDAWLIAQNEATGIDRVSLRIGDDEVGKYCVKKSKPTKTTEVYVNDAEALAHEDVDLMAAFVRHHAQEFAKFVLEQTGAVPDGCEVAVIDVPSRVIGTTITGCRPDVVLPMLGAGKVAGLIEEA